VPLVLLLPEAVALVRKDDVFDGNAVGPGGCDDLVGLDLQDPLVVAAVEHEERLRDPVGVE
jgi:hypothetical protein